MNKKKSIDVSKQVYALDNSIKRMQEDIKLFKELKRRLIEIGKGNYITREELDKSFEDKKMDEEEKINQRRKRVDKCYNKFKKAIG